MSLENEPVPFTLRVGGEPVFFSEEEAGKRLKEFLELHADRNFAWPPVFMEIKGMGPNGGAEYREALYFVPRSLVELPDPSDPHTGDSFTS
jgi:hypothetical protein